MNESSSSPPIPREEFEELILLLIHEVRNLLNVVSLEAADLSEQVEGTADIMRLQQRLRDCSDFLKTARDLLVPDDPTGGKPPLAHVMETLRHRG